MKKLVLFLLITFPIFFSGVAMSIEGDKEHEMPPYYEGSVEFLRIKELAGKWSGVHTMGGSILPAKVTYEITSNGSAVVETLFPGTPHEMVSVYTDVNGKLSMVHYCSIANQPRMDLKSADKGSIFLDFSKDNLIDPAVDEHMHSLKIIINSPNSITHNWSFYKEGKQAGTTEIALTRTIPKEL